MIVDYIFDNLYSKLYSKEPSKDDNTLYEQCVKLSWTQLSHFFNFRCCNTEKCISKGISMLEELHNERNPYKMRLIMKEMTNVIIDGFGSMYSSIDDLIGMMIYIVICAKPKRLFSDIQYYELVDSPIGHIDIRSVFESTIQCIINFKFGSHFKGITEEEYEQYCKTAKENE